jgi:hypothetical protein
MVENPPMSLSDILVKMQLFTGPNSYIIYSGETSFDVEINNKIIDGFNIYLTDNLTYIPIDLNGLDWTFRLQINEVIPSIEVKEAQGNPNIEEVKTQEDTMMQTKIQELENMKEELINQLENLKEKIYN